MGRVRERAGHVHEASASSTVTLLPPRGGRRATGGASPAAAGPRRAHLDHVAGGHREVPVHATRAGGRRRPGRAPRRRAAPRSEGVTREAGTRPRAALRRVDLPAPLGPTTAVMAPSRASHAHVPEHGTSAVSDGQGPSPRGGRRTRSRTIIGARPCRRLAVAGARRAMVRALAHHPLVGHASPGASAWSTPPMATVCPRGRALEERLACCARTRWTRRRSPAPRARRSDRRAPRWPQPRLAGRRHALDRVDLDAVAAAEVTEGVVRGDQDPALRGEVRDQAARPRPSSEQTSSRSRVRALAARSRGAPLAQRPRPPRAQSFTSIHSGGRRRPRCRAARSLRRSAQREGTTSCRSSATRSSASVQIGLEV